MSLVHACAYAYHRLNSSVNPAAGGKSNETADNGSSYPEGTANYARTYGGGAVPNQWNFQIQPFWVKNRTAGMVDGVAFGTSPVTGNHDIRQWIPSHTDGNTNYVNALGFYYGSDIIIRFGEFRVRGGSVDQPAFTSEIGFVKPLCGDIRIPVLDLADPGSNTGSDHMRRFYYEQVLTMWFDNVELRQIGRTLVEHGVAKNEVRLRDVCIGTETSGGAGRLAAVGGTPGYLANNAECFAQKPSSDWRTNIISRLTDQLSVEILLAWQSYVLTNTDGQFDADIAALGWGGAGVWYNKIAELNGGWMDGVRLSLIHI